jgi:hypothetical protein
MKENPSLKDSQTPLGVPFKDLLKISDNGNSGDGFRQGGLVSCWFIGKIETEKMWTNYGDNGKGVAVRSTIKNWQRHFKSQMTSRKQAKLAVFNMSILKLVI